MKKQVYAYNDMGEYIGIDFAYRNPINPDLYLMPHGCTDTAPPSNIPNGKCIMWNGELWELVDKIPTKNAHNDKVINNVVLHQFLNSTDWKVLRHIRELALNQPTSLSHEQYIELEQARAEAAAKIVQI